MRSNSGERISARRTVRARRRIAAAALALAALAALALAGAAHGAPRVRRAATSGCATQFGQFSAANLPPACWQAYGPRSPFNQPIPAAPRLAPESSQIVAYMLAQGWTFPTDRRGRFELERGNRPVYWSRAQDPVVQVACRGHFTCRDGIRLHVPAGAMPQEESDGHMTVVDQAQRREFDFWQASPPEGGRIVTSAASSIPIGPGLGTGLNAAGQASYLALLAGMVRGPELVADHIEHALAMAVQCVQPRDVWPSPARGRGEPVCPGGVGPHLGSLLQLAMSDGEIAQTRAPAWQQALMRAMAHYGLYVVDTTSPDDPRIGLSYESDQSLTSFGLEGVFERFVRSPAGSGGIGGAPIPVSKLRVIAPCVPQRKC